MEFTAAVKKQSGKLVLDGTSLVWKASNGTSQTIDLATVSGMKATPQTAANARIMLTGEGNATLLKVDFMGRDTLDAARDAIQKVIQQVRTVSATPTPGPEPEQAPPATVTAPDTNESERDGSVEVKEKPSKTNGTKSKKTISLDPKKLIANIDLQRQLLKTDEQLRKTFQQVVISGNLTNEQFWGMRLDSLVTAAQAQAQARGSYNVLSTIRPVTGSDNKINLSLTRDKIHDIFDQYPIVRKAYNDNVPKIEESEFWQRFFQSRLFLTLRGERISNQHPVDNILDKYLVPLEEQRKRRKTTSESFVPLYLDVGANAEDVPGPVGNGPDMTMKLGVTDGSTVSLIRSMNVLSKRLLRGKASQNARTAPSVESQDQDLEAQTRLRDLEALKSIGEEIDLTVEASHIPDEVMFDASQQEQFRQALSSQLEMPLNLSSLTSLEKGDIESARKQIDTLLIRQSEATVEADGVDIVNMEDILLVQATTIEFLRHFWDAQLRGNSVEPYIESLKNSLLRIDAVIVSSGPHADQAKAALMPAVQSINKALQDISAM